MLKKIYSKIEKETLLHMVFSPSDVLEEAQRQDIVPDKNFIQCSFLKLQKGKTFRPHKHIYKSRAYEKQVAQESWIVVSGKVRCIFYDLDDSIVDICVLEQGDASFTLHGGHNYEILEENTLIYEYKTGPYEGQEYDKIFLEKA